MDASFDILDNFGGSPEGELLVQETRYFINFFNQPRRRQDKAMEVMLGRLKGGFHQCNKLKKADGGGAQAFWKAHDEVLDNWAKKTS
jgi:hypothetical protein